MADFSTNQHSQAAEMKSAGHEDEAKRLEGEAYKAEMQGAAQYDAGREVEGASIEELRIKLQEAAGAENDYVAANLKYGNKDYVNDVVYIQLAQRRAIIEKTLHTKEREQAA